jgi:hypothetical protein
MKNENKEKDLNEILDILQDLFPDYQLHDSLEGEMIIETGLHMDINKRTVISMGDYN